MAPPRISIEREVGGPGLARVDDGGGHEEVAGAQDRVEAAGEAEADQRVDLRCEAVGGLAGTAGSAAADRDGHAPAPDQVGLGLQAHDDAQTV